MSKSPYIINYKTKDKMELLLIGARHSFNPRFYQFKKIENEFYNFLNRNRNSDLIILTEEVLPQEKNSTKNQYIKKYRETGLLFYLSIKNKIRIKQLLIKWEDIIKNTINNDTQKIDIYVWIISNILLEEYKNNKRKNLNEDTLIKIYPTSLKIKEILKIKKTKKNEFISEFKELFYSFTKKDLYKINFKDLKDIQSPLMQKTKLNSVAKALNNSHDFLMARYIIKEINDKQSIFSVLGLNHVMYQKSIFNDYFKKKSSLNEK